MSALARAIVRAFAEHGPGRIVEEDRPGSDAGVRMDVGRARRELGYRPAITLRDGLQRLAHERAGLA